jgi:hypothetical protein
VLATLVDLVQRDGLGKLDDDQLTGVLQAANRLAAWSAVSGLAARREAAGLASGDWRPFDHVDDEVAVTLTWTAATSTTSPPTTTAAAPANATSTPPASHNHHTQAKGSRLSRMERRLRLRCAGRPAATTPT